MNSYLNIGSHHQEINNGNVERITLNGFTTKDFRSVLNLSPNTFNKEKSLFLKVYLQPQILCVFCPFQSIQ